MKGHQIQLRYAFDRSDSCLDNFQVKQYQCIYLKYRSLENWQEKEDILRCNPDFFGRPRYDCVVINTEPISFGRIHALFTFKSRSRNSYNIALITYLEPSTWKPKTKWEGCQVFKESGRAEFVFAEYLVRGCHMIPAFDKSGRMFYLNDLVDPDAFLRFFLQTRLCQSDI